MIHLAPGCGVRATFVVEALVVTSVSLVRLPKHETRDVKTAEHTMHSLILTRKSYKFSTFDGDLLWAGIGLWRGFPGRCDSGTRVIPWNAGVHLEVVRAEH